ncbi:uncharacterized protein LOC128388515 [Panonychus citri]|uniref:uncharacterized protein LOC128388515 n=1 Tax=Panonychus citri TaxID=50023 RepID=UPI0023081FD4|nr:uncharacterized protein LOC128388515 [Panonychus citri]
MDFVNYCYLYLLILLYVTIKESDLTSLQVIKFEVPEKVVAGNSTKLICSTGPDFGRLATIKWYRNDSEFYRVQFKPPRMKTFPAVGIQINEEKSSKGIVILDNVTLETAGNFRCEVTREMDFTTHEKNGTMDVIEMLPPLPGDSNQSSTPLSRTTIFIIAITSVLMLTC